MGNGILGGDLLQNPGNYRILGWPPYLFHLFPCPCVLTDFYNWNKVYVRYCDGASFSRDTEAQAQDGTTLYFRGLRIFEAVIDELMEKRYLISWVNISLAAEMGKKTHVSTHFRPSLQAVLLVLYP